MRVLSPRMLPPLMCEDGSMGTTATRCDLDTRRMPSASINVLLPAPGGPATPMRSVGDLKLPSSLGFAAAFALVLDSQFNNSTACSR